MARVTVEDCVLRVPNRFDLVLHAAQRAGDITAGADETLPRDNDKNPVIALREIAEDTVSLGELGEKLILGLQKQQPADEITEEDEEVLGALHAESAMSGVEQSSDVAPGTDAVVEASEVSTEAAVSEPEPEKTE